MVTFDREPAIASYKQADPGVAPVLSKEELDRRHNTPSSELTEEVWYKRGKQAFVAKCSACHPAGRNTIKQSKSLQWDDMIRNGYEDQEQIRQIIRYGKGKMPGYASDCADKQDYLQCGVIVKLSEETLQDVQDFVINRANAGWKGRG